MGGVDLSQAKVIWTFYGDTSWAFAYSFRLNEPKIYGYNNASYTTDYYSVTSYWTMTFSKPCDVIILLGEQNADLVIEKKHIHTGDIIYGNANNHKGMAFKHIIVF